MTRTDYKELFKNHQSFSITRIGKEILENSETAQSVSRAHSNMVTGLKVVGWGLFGMFVIRQFTKE